MRDTFIFYRSFFEAIKELPAVNQAELFSAICSYSLDQKAPELTGVSKTVWILVKPILDANNKRFENGSKPKHKQKASKDEAKPKQGGSKPEANKDKDVNKDKDIIFFKSAIEKFGGTKRGPATELEDLKKKHKDWKDILPLIGPAIENQIAYRDHKRAAGVFVPEWKNLKTWLSQRCWEQTMEAPAARAELTVYEKPDMTGGYRP